MKGRFPFFARFLVILIIGLGQVSPGDAQGLALSLTNAPYAILTWPVTNFYSILQSTTNLADPNWQNVGSPMTGGTLSVTPTNAQTFYRIIGQ